MCNSVGILAVLAIGVCLFFAYNNNSQKQDQPPKQRHMLLKKTYNKWLVLIGKKIRRFYQIRIDHNHHYNQNILRIKGGKRKTTKGVLRCYGYHETCWWNSRWCPCQRLCSLQNMEKIVIQQEHQQNVIALSRVIRLHDTMATCSGVMGWVKAISCTDFTLT